MYVKLVKKKKKKTNFEQRPRPINNEHQHYGMKLMAIVVLRMSAFFIEFHVSDVLMNTRSTLNMSLVHDSVNHSKSNVKVCD